MRKGVVTDVREAAQAISAAVEQAERVAGLAVEGMYVGIAGAHIQSTNSRGVAPIRGNHGVTQEDVHRAIEAAEAIAVPANRDIVHSIPRGYMLDGQDGIKDPIGMVGHRLEIEAHIVTGSVASIQNLIRAVEEAGVKTIDLVLEPIAAGGAVLTSAEREMGVVLVDIGGGTTDIAVFIEGSVWHTVILPTGGMHVTNDLAIGLRAPFLAAEEMKLRCGHVDPSQIDEGEVLEVAAFGENGKSTVSRRHMTEIIRARVEEILRLVLIEVKRSGYDNLLPAGVVLSGGASQLPGLTAFAHDILQLPIRLGVPEDLRDLRIGYRLLDSRLPSV
jgi:cell division protein FtsA